uniref:Protein mago nashi n=1 Tax=Lotharella vacuolata TaxID=74820 RepID=A0A0H5BGZ6_9EUKA|nr:protein mago nashi [Lotharella vacuolata]
METLYIRYCNQHKGRFGIECEEIEMNKNKIYYINFSNYREISSIKKFYKIGDIFKNFLTNFLLAYNIIEENIYFNEKDTDLNYQELEIFFNKTHISFRIPRILPFYRLLGSRDPIKLKKLITFFTVKFIIKIGIKKYYNSFNTRPFYDLLN